MLPPPEQDFSIYVGFPFCKKACAYCHYKPNIHFGVSEIPGNYLDTLLKQIRYFLQENSIADKTLPSCYFGGGTPSLLTLKQVNAIKNLFDEFNISFVERSIEVHPAMFNEEILESAFFNRFSIGIQSIDQKRLEKWNREVYSIERIQNICALIKDNVHNSNINFDFLFRTSILEKDIQLVHNICPDTVVFYPQTGLRTELEAAETFSSLKKAAFILDDFGYFRNTESSFHFYKSHNSQSKYAQSEYSFTNDIIGFGHNSISRIGIKSYLSLYEDNYTSYRIKERKNNVIQELLCGSLLYGVPEALEKNLHKEIVSLLRINKHSCSKYIPLEKETWEKLFTVIKQFSQETQELYWRCLFWADSRSKNIDDFFEYLEQEHQKILHEAIENLPAPKEIPEKNILIEGIDGSGKDTFAEMLLGYLKMISIKSASKSISLVGLPASQAAYGVECKKFIEDANLSVSYNDIKKMLKCNRDDFCHTLNRKYPGLHIFIRDILTAEGTLACLFPDRYSFDEFETSKIDFCIIINTDPLLAKKRVENRGIKETWRESLDYLNFFNSFFLSHCKCFSLVNIVDNTTNSLDELRIQALKTAIQIYRLFY